MRVTHPAQFNSPKLLRATLLALCVGAICLSAPAHAIKEHEFKTMAQCAQMQASHDPNSSKPKRYQLCFEAMNGVRHRSPEGKSVICHVRNLKELDYAYECKAVPLPKDLKAWQREIVEQATPLRLVGQSYSDLEWWSGHGVALDNRAQMGYWANLAGRAAACGEDIIDFGNRVDTALDRSVSSTIWLFKYREMFRINLLDALYRYLPDPREQSDALIARVQRELNYERYSIVDPGSFTRAWREHEFYRKAGLPVWDRKLDCAAAKALLAETVKRLPPPFVAKEPEYSFKQWEYYANQIYSATLCSIDTKDAEFRMRRWIMQAPPTQDFARFYAIDNTNTLNDRAEERAILPRDCQAAALEFVQVKFPEAAGAEEWLQRYPTPWGPGRQRRADYFKDRERLERWAKTMAKALWCELDVREMIVASELWIDRQCTIRYQGVGKNECRPRVRHRDNGDGTVSARMQYSDSHHPMWKKCPEGLSGERCERGKARLFTPSEAQAYVKQHGFAGYSDWKLPRKQNVGELLERHCYNPSIDLKYFPNTPSGMFLTSAEGHNTALDYVDFFGGSGYGTAAPEDVYYLRLMREDR